MTSLYLYFVQGYQPVQIGLAFLPTNITMGLLSLGLSGLLVHAFGLRWPLAVGLAVAAAGLFLLSGVPVGADFNRDLLPGLLLFGVGAGLAVNSSFSMGGALWLAIFTSYAAWTTQSVGGPEGGGLEALNSGYKAAFFGAACLLSLAAVVTALGLKGPHRAPRAAPILEERYESLE
jgi:hypothetical protein